MKHLILTLALLTCSLLALAQKGISYQAVILDPKPIEIPGQDITGQPFVNGAVSLKFKIFSSTFVQEFEEVHATQTDAYGMVNVLIGSVSQGAFSSLIWDSNPKNMQVWVSFDQGGTYTKVSEQVLTYNPYAIYAETAGKLGGTLGIAAGGTGATTAAGARTNLGLGNVDNTSDANKPISIATQLALDAKTDALTSYVNNQVAAATIADADATTKGKIQLAGDLSGTAAAPTVPSLALKADAAAVNSALGLKANASDVTASLVLKEDVSNKANTPLGTSTILFPTQNAVKTYVDAQVASATIADASSSTKGKIQLAGDLAGTAAAPTVPGLALKANASDVTASLNLKANAADVTTALNLKASAADLTAGLALKLDANQKGAANGVATLNSSGIIPSGQLPPVTLSSTSVVANNTDMMALSSATVGSIAIRTDVNKNYVLSALPASVMGNWIELLTPAAPVQTVNGYTGVVNLAKADLGLADVDNTSDASKPVSNATQAALNLKLDANKVGVATGVASLNALGKVPTDQIPAISFSSVKVLGSQAEMLALSSAVVGSVVIRTDVNKNYVLAQADPTVLSNWIELLTPAPPVQTVNGYAGSVSLTKSDLGLGNVDNTSDASKPISSATQTELNAKANTADMTAALALKSPLASPSFTGTVAIGTTNPSPSAVLDVTSTSKGLLLPRLTFAQKSAIVSPEPGLIFWCTDCGTSGEMQVYNGTAYVNMIGSPAQLGMPAIGTTTGMSSITSSTASSGGVISSDGGAAITARGVVWGTSTNPTIALSTKTTDGTGTGTFTSSLTGLTSGVTYYVRSYATNSVGTKYGSEITFNSLQSAPTLAATTAASSIGATTATSGGTISYNGGATVTVSGLVWSTSTTPTIVLSTKTTNGTLTGTYTSAISGLTPGTLYYVRSYATNAVGTSYGAQTSFTTLTTPTLAATTAASSITSTSATSGGNISSDGGSAVSARGIVWGTATNPTTALTTKTTTGTGTGTYTSNLTGLSPATTYYVRSYATNAIGTVYGAEISFTTLAVAPTLATTTAASSIAGTSATSGGNVSSDGGAAVTARGIVWGIATNPTTALTTKTTDGTGTGTYASSLTGLSPATLYYVRSYATNAIGTSYGAEISFTTLAVAPTLAATTAASSITSTTATSGGTISTDGGSAVTAKGVVWGTATNPTTALSTKTTDGTGSVAFTSSLTGLTAATTYYVRSYATNAIGTSYGTEISFTTLAVAPTLSTTAASSITKYAASSGGTITSNGGSVITASGICWSTSATPTTSDSKTTDGTTTGTFTSSITGLTAGTVYYVRAYATNAIGTSYGAAQSFTTLSPPPVQTAVLIGNKVWTDKNLDVATYRNGDAISFAANAAEWTALNNRQEGAYMYLLFANTNGGQTYGKLYNWYAVNDPRGLAPVGYHIPTNSEFETLRSIDPTGFTFRSNTTDWGANFTNSNDNLIVSNRISTPVGDNSTGFNVLPGGNLSPTGSNLNGGSGWFWNADATSATAANWTYFISSTILNGVSCCGGYDKGNAMSVRLVKDNNTIETASTSPTLAATTTATSITTTTAVLGGNVTDEGLTQVSARGLVYGTTTGSSTFNVAVGSGAGTFTGTLTGLAQGTTYYVRSFATNAQGTAYGAETSFTTLAVAPTLAATTAATSITGSTATSGGNVSADGGAAVTARGVVWATSTNPTTALTTKTTNGTGTGTYTSSLTGLAPLTTYYVRSYATNSVGTVYGTEISFTTLAVVPTQAAITTQPSGAVNGVALTTQPVIRLTDGSGNTATTSTASVVAAIASGTGGTLSGTTTVAAVNGVATFNNLVLSGTAGNFTLVFTPTSLTAATSSSFALAAGAASKVMITTQPAGAFTGTAFSTQPVVKITDAGGNTITSSTANVVASIASGTGTLSGTTTVAAVAGVATFTNLNITGTGNFTLTFTADGGLTAATSNTVNVAQLGCAQGGNCAIGETGPGGGTVFYYSAAGFNCGASFTSPGSPTGGLCHYLEYAPAGWNGGPQADPYAYWSPNTTTSVGATSTAIGSGYKNTELMRVNNGTIFHPDTRPYAGAYIRSKTLGGKSDWYLPSKDELNQLCKSARGLPATTPDIDCDGTAGTLSNAGWVADHYWSSSENDPSKAYSRDFRGNTVYLGKIWNFVIRPIRAF